MRGVAWVLWMVGALAACDDAATQGLDAAPDAAPVVDAGPTDASLADRAIRDATLPADGTVRDAAAADRGVPDQGRVDASPADAAVPDMAPRDMAADGMAAPDMAAPDMATPDMAAPDMATPDMATPDMATPDAGPAGPVACAARDACPPDHLCVAGRCAAYVEVEEGADGFVQVEDLVAACDADGTVRLLTQLEPEVDRRFGHLIVGRPGAWEVSAPLGMAWRNSTQLTNGTRQAGQTAHLSFLAHAYRGIVVDGRGTVTEERVITRHDHAFTAGGALWLLTQPQIPAGIDDRFPLRLWRPLDGAWEVDEVERDVGFGLHHHLRFDAAGRPEILRLVGGVGGLVRRYRQGVAGWETENIWRENLGGNAMAGAAINGPDGKTHILLGNIDRERLTLVYLQVGDAGVERQVTALDAALRYTYLPESLQFDDDGNLYFLAHGPASPQSQRPAEVRRIDPQGEVSAGVVDYIDFDARGADRQALAVAPDGDFYLFTARRDRRMRIRTWRLAR